MWIGLQNQRPFAFAGLWEQWTSGDGEPLDLTFQHIEPLKALLRPYLGEDLIAYPVSTLVNNPRHDVPQCFERVSV
jgi:putative SOS response-associated peptidase YedK